MTFRCENGQELKSIRNAKTHLLDISLDHLLVDAEVFWGLLLLLEVCLHRRLTGVVLKVTFLLPAAVRVAQCLPLHEVKGCGDGLQWGLLLLRLELRLNLVDLTW